MTFESPIEKEVTRTDTNGAEITINLSLTLQFIDRARFIASSLSNLVNNFPQGTHEIKCKYGRDDKKFESYGITCEVCNC